MGTLEEKNRKQGGNSMAVKRNIKQLKSKLKQNNIMVTKEDKGNSVVLIDTEEYTKKGNKFIKSKNYEEIKYDYTNKFQSRVKK